MGCKCLNRTTSRRLAAITGIGVITATAIAATVTDPAVTTGAKVGQWSGGAVPFAPE